MKQERKMARKATKHGVRAEALPMEVKIILEKCDTKQAWVTLPKLNSEDVQKATINQFDQTPVVNVKGQKEGSKDKNDNIEELPENVQKEINQDRKSFMQSLEDSDDENDKENADNKENDKDLAPKKSQVWRPTLGERKPMTPLHRVHPHKKAKKEEPKELPEYEKVRLENIAEQKKMFLEKLKKKSMELLPKSQPRAPAQYRRKIKVLERTYSTRSSTGRSSGASTPHKEFSLPAEFEDTSDEEFVGM